MTRDGQDDLLPFASAALLAAQAHAGQLRKGGDVPYVNHVLEVAAMVVAAGGTRAEAVAALLHDCVEDTDLTIQAIRSDFGDEVADLVEGLTDAPEWADLPRPDRKARQAAHLPDAPEGVRRIKIADQCSNLRDIIRLPDAWDASSAAEYIAGAEEVVAACRGASAQLESAFDAALAEAMQKTGEMR